MGVVMIMWPALCAFCHKLMVWGVMAEPI